jgi:hypothetical protein
VTSAFDFTKELAELVRRAKGSNMAWFEIVEAMDAEAEKLAAEQPLPPDVNNNG